MLSYQEEERLKPCPPAPETTATLLAVEGGLARLRFGRSGEESQKWYRLAPGQPFAAGQRVRIEKASGTYLVRHPL